MSGYHQKHPYIMQSVYIIRAWLRGLTGGDLVVDMKMVPPGGKRKHTFIGVERNGVPMLLDYTDMNKKKSNDSARFYRLEGGELVFDHYERVDIVRRNGYR